MKHMPFFKNITVYRVTPEFCEAAMTGYDWWRDLPHFMETDFPVGINVGFIPPCEAADDIGYAVTTDGDSNRFGALTLRVQTRPVSSKAVAQAAERRARVIEQQQGYKPGRKQMREIKEDVLLELQRKAPPVYRDTRAIFDFKERWLYVDSCTGTRVDEFVGMLARHINPLPLLWLHTNMAPTTLMTNWARDGEADSGGFTVDQTCTFKSPNAAQAAYRNITIEQGNVEDHIRAGLSCVRLALTWMDQVSFVLDEHLRLRSFKPLGVVTETLDPSESDFDSNVFLFGATMADLMADLVAALDGEKGADDPAADL